LAVNVVIKLPGKGLPENMKQIIISFIGNRQLVLEMAKRDLSATLYARIEQRGLELVRDVMRRYIPESVADAEKQGFSAPDASWFKGESIELVKRRLMNKQAKIYQLFDRKAVEPLVAQHLNGEQNRRLLIWSLLNVEAYLGQVS